VTKRDDRIEKVRAILLEDMVHRGHSLTTWPEDEAAAYRANRGTEGIQRAFDIQSGKAAIRIVDALFPEKGPNPEPERTAPSGKSGGSDTADIDWESVGETVKHIRKLWEDLTK
jgi:hypothetical protein